MQQSKRFTWRLCFGIALLAVFGLASGASAQVGSPGAYGNFGVDADVRADTTELPLASAGLNTDDWFHRSTAPGTPGTGYGVIDTTGGAIFRALMLAGTGPIDRNQTFVRGLAPGLPPSDLAAVYARDNNTAGGAKDTTVFTGTKDKNADNPRTLNLGLGDTPQKNDLIDVGAFLRRDELTGILYLYAFSTTRSSDGDSHVDIEFFHADTRFEGGVITGLGPDSGHTAWQVAGGLVTQPGDVIISADFTGGGSTPEFSVRIWVRSSDWVANGSFGPFTFTDVISDAGLEADGFGYAEILLPATGPAAVVGAVNQRVADGGNGSTIGPPWGSLEGSGAAFQDSILDLQLSEIAVNLTLLGLDIPPEPLPCAERLLGNVMFKTRSSQEFTAELKDFVGPFFFGTEFEPPTCSIDPALQEICDGDPAVTFNVSVLGGNPPFTYDWTVPAGATDPGDVNSITTDVDGLYSVIVSDVKFCTTFCQAQLIVNPNPTCTITPAQEICDGDPAVTITVTAANGEAPYSYAWTVPAGASDPGDVASFSTDVDGSYSVLITDNNGCQTTCQTTLTVNPNPTCTITPAQEICDGDPAVTITVTAANGEAPYSYAWTVPAGASDPGDVASFSTDVDGSYSVLITDNNGCQTTCQTTLTVNPNPTCTITPAQEICDGDPAVTITVTAANGEAPYSYAWTVPAGASDPGDVASFSTDVDGSYSVLITDNNGCQTTCQTTLTVNPNPTCTITPAQEICDGDPAVTITVTAANGEAPYSYAWTVPAGASDPGDVASFSTDVDGSYSVLITDNNGCQTTCQTTLTVNPNPTCTISPDQFICDGDPAVTITVTPASGQAPYSYAWTVPAGASDPGDVASFQTDVDGSYSVLITDDNGCQTTCQTSLTVWENPTCTISPDQFICDGDAAVTITVTPAGGQAPYSYAWTVPAGASDPGDVASFQTDVDGSYSVLITDDNGCQTTCGTRLTVWENPTCTISPDQFICDGDPAVTITVTPAGGQAPYSYAWTVPAGASDPGDVASFQTDVDGSYSVLITDDNGCQTTCQTSLTVWDNPTCTISPDQFICDGDPAVTITVTPAGGQAPYSYAWTVPAGASDPGDVASFQTDVDGSYSVLITDDNGCQTTCGTRLTVWENPTCEITPPQSICAGDPAVTIEVFPAGGQPPYSYDWTVPAGASDPGNVASFQTDVDGSYSVLITDDNGCQTTCQTSLTVYDNPTCQLTPPQSICDGDPAVTIEVTSVVGQAPFTYSWTVPAGASDPGNVSSFQTDVAGTYSVMITDDNGCVTNCQTTLTVWENPTCTISPDQFICDGDPAVTITVTPAGGQPPYSYAWTVPAGASDPGDVASFQTDVDGSYSVLITDDNGCQTTCGTRLTVWENPTCTISPDQFICDGDPAVTITVTPAGGQAPYSYAWTVPAGASDPGDVASFQTDVDGSYSVLITDDNGCQTTCQTSLTVWENPTCTISPDQFICDGDPAVTITVTPAGGQPPYSYAWTVPAGASDPGDVASFQTDVDGSYSVLITDDNGCQTTCGTRLTVWENPTCTISPDQFICDGDPDVTITVTPAGGQAPYNYAWTVPAGAADPGDVASFQTDVDGSYSVLITDDNGCQTTCQTSLTVWENPTCEITPPQSICDGDAAVTIEVFPAGGQAPYSYDWTVPAGATDPGNVASFQTDVDGSYSVLITDDNGCQTTCQTSLTVWDNPTCTITPPQSICDYEDPVTITVTPAGGQPPYSYAWTVPSGASDPGDVASFDTDVDGGYSVLITDDNGCETTCRTTLTVNEQPSCNILEGEPVCPGLISTELCVTVTGGVTPYSYAWTVPAGVADPGDSDCTGQVDQPGDYIVVVTDAVGCTTSCMQTLIEECPDDEFCSFTQGFYGNEGGYKNGVGTKDIIAGLLAPPYPLLVIGELGRSVTFAVGSEQCIINLLPGGGPATTLPDEALFTDETIAYPNCQTDPELPTNGQGRIVNVLLSQTIALSLNVRYDGALGSLALCRFMSTLEADCGTDGCCGRPPICVEDDDTAIPGTWEDYTIAQSVFDELDALGWGYTVDDLLRLANSALAGNPLTHTTLSAVSYAADAVNNMFDECRFLDHCGPEPRPTFTVYSTMDAAKLGNVPYEYSLNQNYPNPFNPSTVISYALDKESQVELAVFNVLGQRVATLATGHQAPGQYQVTWNGRDDNGTPQASGLYFYRLVTDERVSSRKMMLLK